MQVLKESYLIKEFAKRNYHYADNGEPDEVVNLIDCWDQILYVVLVNRGIDIVDFFCGDISPEFYGDGERFGLRRIEEDVNQYFKLDKAMADGSEDCIDEIERNIRKDLPIAMTTMFDMLPNYDWYEEEIIGSHNGHSNMIVGYDRDNVYVIDSPLVFVEGRDKRLGTNKSIHLIGKKYVRDALKAYCDLMTVQYAGNFVDKGLPAKLKNIEYNYWNRPATGRKAFEEYIDSVEKAKGREIHIDLYEMHLLYGRHELLRLYIKKHLSENDGLRKIEHPIEKCCEEWFALKMLVQRKGLLEKREFAERIGKQVENVMAYEDKLFDAIHCLV